MRFRKYLIKDLQKLKSAWGSLTDKFPTLTKITVALLVIAKWVFVVLVVVFLAAWIRFGVSEILDNGSEISKNIKNIKLSTIISQEMGDITFSSILVYNIDIFKQSGKYIPLYEKESQGKTVRVSFDIQNNGLVNRSLKIRKPVLVDYKKRQYLLESGDGCGGMRFSSTGFNELDLKPGIPCNLRLTYGIAEDSIVSSLEFEVYEATLSSIFGR